MEINRRELRKQLGSRTARRRGTKSKAIPQGLPGSGSGPNGALNRYTKPRHVVARVSTRVEAAIRQLAREKAATA